MKLKDLLPMMNGRISLANDKTRRVTIASESGFIRSHLLDSVGEFTIVGVTAEDDHLVLWYSDDDKPP